MPCIFYDGDDNAAYSKVWAKTSPAEASVTRIKSYQNPLKRLTLVFTSN